MTDIRTLAPQGVWHYFYQLTQIPRPSHQEAAVQQFVLDEAARLGLEAERDAVGNIIVRKPAAAGYEKAAGVILQAHLDMVAQKNADTVHDFCKDPIRAYVDGEWVTAEGTTLGADNGIGAAAALAVLADASLLHGPLEALFTATEETGMDGAKGLQGGRLQGDILLNLDSETLGEICIGCAGGADAAFSLPLASCANASRGYQLQIRGLKGGHSGIDIHKQRGNALKILARLLLALGSRCAVSAMHGGNLRNAIPREAEALFASQADLPTLQTLLEDELAIIRRSLPIEDRSMTAVISEAQSPAAVWTPESQRQALAFINLLPDGVDRMSETAKGITETSSNLASIRTESDCLTLHCLLRSLDNDARDNLTFRMEQLAQLSGGSAVFSGQYPGWQPNPDAPILKTAIRCGEAVLGKTPEAAVIHAGLECGLLAQHYPNWQMISFGPTIEMPHSPDERVHIASVALFWQWLLQILTAIAHR